jgi:hypothetical protein
MTNSVAVGQVVPAAVNSGDRSRGRRFSDLSKKPASAGLEVLLDFSSFTMVDFMIWKGVALVIGAIIYGFWLGLTGR